MSVVRNEAAVLYSLTTAVAGTLPSSFRLARLALRRVSQRVIFIWILRSSNLLNGRYFTVTVGGWVKAHGATQTVAPGLQIFHGIRRLLAAKTASWNGYVHSGGVGKLVAGTFYDFIIRRLSSGMPMQIL